MFANLDQAIRELPYSKAGLTPATQALLESIEQQQSQVLAKAALAAEQPLRTGMDELLQTCMKEVSGDQFDQTRLYTLLTGKQGMYHIVASLIVTAFSDVWPVRDKLGEASLERALAEKLSLLKRSRETLQSLNSSGANASNLHTFNMVMFLQLALLQEWKDKAPGS